MNAPLDPSDEDLLRAFGRGHDASFEVLMKRHGADVKAYGLRMLKNAELAEEVYIETFTRLALGRGRWESRGTVRGFLFTVAHRYCIDVLRRRRRERDAVPHLLEFEGNRTLQPSPEARAILGEAAIELERALAALPEAHRQVILLRVVHGLSGEEVAHIVGLTEEQVRSQLSYARKCIRESIDEAGGRHPAARAEGAVR